MKNAKTCVVICYWKGRSVRRLYQLLNQMLKIDAGAPFKLVIVCNGGDKQPLTLPQRFEKLKAQILNRENAGYNIMAWDFGWRVTGKYDFYLFLQDECFLKKAGWISEFEYRMSNDQNIGLLGEKIMWNNQTWNFIRQATDRDIGKNWFKGESIHPLDFYQSYIKGLGMPLTEVGTHLMSIIIFIKSSTLEEINGFLPCETYREAVSSEISLSRVIASKGYRISCVKDQSFSMIGHHQWTKKHEIKMELYDKLKKTKIYAVLKNLMFKRAH